MSKPKPLHVYIAGPMRGLMHYNYPAFIAAAARLEDAGYKVTNPAALFGGRMNLPRNVYLAKCFRALTHCNAIALLDGWRDSEGASCEAHIAQAMRMTRICAYSCKPLPWWLQDRAA